MFKHNCVECLEKHYLKCMWNIGFFDRFFGTDKVKYCPEYVKIIEKIKKIKWRKK
jgi:hypothetical protein